ncbi:MAG: hypothetical protein ABEJ72_01810 [Candidatus Aenigmatarchaeota archaeon]
MSVSSSLEENPSVESVARLMVSNEPGDVKEAVEDSKLYKKSRSLYWNEYDV